MRNTRPEVIEGTGPIKVFLDPLAHLFPIYEWAVRRHTHDYVKVICFGRFAVSGKNIMLVSPETVNPLFSAEGDNRFVILICGRGHNERESVPTNPFNVVMEHWPPIDVCEHLSWKTGACHPGLAHNS